VGGAVRLRKWVVPTLAAVALVSSCGQHNDRDGSVHVDAASGAFDTLQGEANRVYASFAGNRMENDAAGVLQAWALNGSMDQCMAEAGFPEWDWSTARNYGVNPGNGLGGSDLFEEPLRLSFALAAIASKGAAEREAARMGEEPSGPLAAAIDVCAADPEVREGSDETAPSMRAITRMRNRWFSFVGGLDKYGDVAGYYRCLQAADLDVLQETGQPIDNLDVALSMSYPSRASEIPGSLDAPITSPAWRHAVELEQQFAKASWNCRADIYETHADQVLGDVLAFEDEWASEITGIAADWDAVVTRAEALGWDPTTNTVSRALKQSLVAQRQ